MKLHPSVILLGIWMIAGTGSAFGQTAFASEFDLNKPIHIEGKVTKLEWITPHAYADIAVLDSNGRPTTWRAELSSPNHLFRGGLTRTSIQVGDDVVVEGFVAKSGNLRAGTSSILVQNSAIVVTIPPELWHHSIAAEYDNSMPVQQTGRLESIESAGLRRIIHFTVTMPDGRMESWSAELVLTSPQDRQRWNQSLLHPGDGIQIDGAGAKGGSRKLLAKNVTLIAVGGQELASPRILLNGR